MNGATVLTKFTADTKDFDSKTKGVTASLGSITKGVVAGLGITKAFSAAWSAVTRNMDSAIDRFDTLNNFPKVMSNLGIGAEESQKSIDKMSEALVGLPTTLDEGALAVQRLTSKNGDIKKSTNLFLAMNNAILAGGAPAQIQSTAIEQLSQAYAKGKPDMMEWRTLMTAMPAQLKQVATAMGYVDADSLGEALREGNVSMDEFMNTIVDLNEKGLPGFQNFEEQARNSTGGIRTAITNMNSRITQGVTAMIESVDKGLKDAKLGGIAKAFETIGNTVRETLKSLAPYITQTLIFLSQELPKIISFVSQMIPYLTTIGIIIAGWKIGKTIQGIVQGFQSAKLALALFSMESNGVTIAQAALNGTLKAGEVITALLTGKVTLLELAQAGLAKAQAVLNAVMAANPIALIIVGIVALIAIFVLLWNKCEWFRNFWIGLWSGIVEIVVGAWEWIKGLFTGIIDFISNNWQALLLFLVNPFAGAFKLLYDNCEGFRKFVDNFVNAVVNFFKSIPGKLVSFAQGIINVFASIPGQMLNIGKNIVQGLWNGITGLKDWVISKVKNLGKSILNSIKNVLGIHSPSTEFAMIGKFSVLGYTEELDKMTKTVQGQIAETFSVSPQLANSSSLHYSPNVVVNTVNNISQDPLGRMVNDIKTFSGGAKNDYNYGMGVS